MIYPMVLMTLTIVVVILMLTVVLASFTGIILAGGGELPLPTKMLIGLSDFLRSYWYPGGRHHPPCDDRWRAFKRSDKGTCGGMQEDENTDRQEVTQDDLFFALCPHPVDTPLERHPMLQSIDITAGSSTTA